MSSSRRESVSMFLIDVSFLTFVLISFLQSQCNMLYLMLILLVINDTFIRKQRPYGSFQGPLVNYICKSC